MKQYKAILNLHTANELIKRGFKVVEVKPSTKIRGRAAFFFEVSPKFEAALRELSK